MPHPAFLRRGGGFVRLRSTFSRTVNPDSRQLNTDNSLITLLRDLLPSYTALVKIHSAPKAKGELRPTGRQPDNIPNLESIRRFRPVLLSVLTRLFSNSPAKPLLHRQIIPANFFAKRTLPITPTPAGTCARSCCKSFVFKNRGRGIRSRIIVSPHFGAPCLMQPYSSPALR